MDTRRSAKKDLLFLKVREHVTDYNLFSYLALTVGLAPPFSNVRAPTYYGMNNDQFDPAISTAFNT